MSGEKIQELKIISVRDVLSEEDLSLFIPEYQRPYKWTVRHVQMLIDDILFFKSKKEYRLGTLILHKNDDTNGKYNIVDGQQRVVTLLLIAKAFKMGKIFLDILYDITAVS